MKVLTYAICHYGVEYFDAALQSVLPVSDKVIILYSPHPSQGHNTELPCPDTRDELKLITDKYDKVQWVEVDVSTEGQHTDLIYNYSEGYDILLRFDLDEIFDPIDLPKALEYVYSHNSRYYAINGFHHFWKSFDKVLTDGFRPVRFCKPTIKEETTEEINCKIYHFGYCQNLKTIEYKLRVTGHFDEIRPEWLELYKNYKDGDYYLHPTSKTIWHRPEHFDKNNLPECLKLHPNFNKETV